MNEMGWFFVGGAGRTGTTVLRRALARHPALADVPEWRMLTDPDGPLDLLRGLDAAWAPFAAHVRLQRLERFLRRLGRAGLGARALDWAGRKGLLPSLGGRKTAPAYAQPPATSFCPGYFGHLERYLEATRELAYDGTWAGAELLSRGRMLYCGPGFGPGFAAATRAFCEALAAETLARQGAAHWLEKSTHCILCFDALREVLPQARLVHIRREPMDAVASLVRQRWAPSDPLAAARWHADVLRRWEAVRAVLPREAYLEIDLEDLAADPRAVLGGVCDFFGLPWHDALLDEPLGAAHSGRWRRDFDGPTAEAVRRVLDAAGEGRP